MIELIIVIVIAGILAAVMLPRLERDPAREAAEQVAQHIRYAQHLAMVDDVYDAANPDWHENRWSIDLCSPQYLVSRANNTEVAIDPLSKDDINGSKTEAFDLDKRFGVTTSPLSGNCKITFDNLGRPYLSTSTTVSDTPTTTDTTVSLTANGKTYTLTVIKQTGYTVVNY